MRPKNLKTKLFLDSGDPKETQEALDFLGFLDGQTTNPTLIAKNPDAQKRLKMGKKFTQVEIYSFYKKVVKEISELLPDGSVSIEVYADSETSAQEMFAQSQDMFSWIPNAHIKYPITAHGLQVAHDSIKAGMRVNMTLCFSEDQAASVYSATQGAKKGDVFVSPFIGRLDDRGENGMDLVKNILKMYCQGDGHVEVLAASVRSMEHFLCSLYMKCDIITAPIKILKAWVEGGMMIPDESYSYDAKGFAPIKYSPLLLSKPWKKYDISHELTEKGMQKFTDDWNALIV